MFKLTFRSYTITLLFGIAIGVSLFFLWGASSEDKDEPNEIVPSGFFGNLRIFKTEVDSFSGTVEGLLIADGNNPLVAIAKDASDRIVRIAFIEDTGEEMRTLAKATLEDGKINLISVPAQNGEGGFVVHRGKNDSWGFAEYLSKPDPYGEYYCDIDFDSQFDGMAINNKREVLASAIFLNGKWVDALVCVLRESRAMLEIESGYAEYKFEKDKGWIKTKEVNRKMSQ